jgi:hypothetical protein
MKALFGLVGILVVLAIVGSTEYLSVPAMIRVQFGAQYLLLDAGLAVLLLDVYERLPTV